MFKIDDLDSIAASDNGYTFAPTHPVTGKPLDITITVCGADGKRYRNKLAALNRKRMQALDRTGKRSAALNTAQLEEDAIALLAAATVEWTGISADGVNTLDCTEENALMVYTKLPWLREQVDAAVNDRANFLGESAPA
jgi:hypothetical protein